MKLFKNIAFALAAVSCVQFAAAQQAPKLNAYVALPGGAAGLLELERGDGNGSFFYMQKGTDQLMQAKASASCSCGSPRCCDPAPYRQTRQQIPFPSCPRAARRLHDPLQKTPS